MKWILRLGINRGLMGGNRFFATLGVVAGLIRLLQRLSGSGPKTLYTHKLQPGDSLVITQREKRR